jgi:type III secretion protein W
MSSNKVPGAGGVNRASLSVNRQKMQSMAAKMLRQTMRQVASKASMRAWLDTGFNQIATRKNFKTLEEQHTKKRDRTETKRSDEIEEAIESIGTLEEVASRFNKDNPELQKRILIALRNSIKDTDSVEEILKKVLDFYPDYTLADDALDFLLETTHGNLGLRILQAKHQLNTQYEREIVAGRNIGVQAKEFSEEGLGSPTALRDMYRDVTGNPRTPNTLFDELSDKFTYSNMKTVISFLLHSLGADLKSKGPSISRAELHRLVDDTRSLQAILGVYRFFKSRMGLVTSQFRINQLAMPNRLTFELIAKQFMSLLSERYITTDKIFNLGRILGLSEELLAQIILYTQLKDAIRQVSPRLYKNLQQKEDLLTCLLEALEELEEELEEDEDEDDEDDDNE